MTVPWVFALPWSIYSHCTTTATQSTLLTPTITSSSPSICGKRQKLYFTPLQRCPIQTVPYGNTLPQKKAFSFCLQQGYFLHPSQQVQASSIPSLLSVLWWKCAMKVVGGGSRYMRTEKGPAIKAVELEEQKAGWWPSCSLLCTWSIIRTTSWATSVVTLITATVVLMTWSDHLMVWTGQKYYLSNNFVYDQIKKKTQASKNNNIPINLNYNLCLFLLANVSILTH